MTALYTSVIVIFNILSRRVYLNVIPSERAECTVLWFTRVLSLAIYLQDLSDHGDNRHLLRKSICFRSCWPYSFTCPLHRCYTTWIIYVKHWLAIIAIFTFNISSVLCTCLLNIETLKYWFLCQWWFFVLAISFLVFNRLKTTALLRKTVHIEKKCQKFSLQPVLYWGHLEQKLYL